MYWTILLFQTLNLTLCFEELQNLENLHPEYFDRNSPTQRVGGSVIDGFVSVPHKYRMLSLGNTYSERI